MSSTGACEANGRSANYGSRIDLILCTPGLRPWIKGGDIQAKVYGSDHCPVYIDLHDSIEQDGKTVYIRDLLNPKDRPPSTGTVFPWDEPRTAPEPPRFATKFMEEFSTKQRTLKSLWAAKPKPKPKPAEAEEVTSEEPLASETPPEEAEAATPMGIARAAFGVLDTQGSSSTQGATQLNGTQTATQSSTSASAQRQSNASPKDPTPPSRTSAGESPRPEPSAPVDLTLDDSPPTKKVALARTKSDPPKGKGKKPPPGGQAKLAAFWTMPKAKAKPKAEPSPPPLPPPATSSASQQPMSLQDPSTGMAASDTMQDEILAQALADEDAEKEAERERLRKEKNQAAAPQWANMFAPKKAPLCTVHHHPCKDFSESRHLTWLTAVVKIPGPNKGKRFWLCSK